MTPAEKKALSERDICTKFITPALTDGNKWDLMNQIREEVSFTKGRVIVRGQFSTRGEAKRADYLLSYKPGRHEVKSPADEQRLQESIRGVEKKWWSKPGQEHKRKENEFAWRVSRADIAARGYSLDVKNPHTVDDAHRNPAELPAAVAEVREKLRRELETALARWFY